MAAKTLQLYRTLRPGASALSRCLVIDVRELPTYWDSENPRVSYVAVSPSSGQPFGSVYSCSERDFLKCYVEVQP